ncbi:MAG: M14 family zinc carboxypeptidase [Anaerolineaceae bacterium]|nr:M14 family zinc carboxypeptidase [Anaerolineaceae bacterium]MDD4043318.1 M14 family zinc carboxypeptidase [Anaerolineaceae bacterium]MDD4577766.1 M14 family zinc carboxypeptidase [Anaerolineaceae bacterium]
MLTRISFYFHLILAVGVLILSSFSSVQAGNAIQNTVPGYNCYRDSATILESMQTLVIEYPDLVQLSVIGNSWEGKPIHLLTLTNRSAAIAKPRLVIVSGLRANAFAPVELSLRFAERLLSGYGAITENTWMLDQLELQMIVLANPDGRGRAEAQALDGIEISWQNNTHNGCDSKENGVRLDGNFSFNWKASAFGPCDPAYSGAAAGSEPETQAIMNYLEELGEQADPILLINLDNYKNQILSPYLSDPTADNPHLETLYTLAEKIGYNTLSAPIMQGDVSNPVLFGTLVDYAYGEAGFPALSFSMGDSMAGGYVSRCWYFEGYLLEKNIAALVRALKLSPDPYHQAYGPEIGTLGADQGINSVLIEGSADDYTYWYENADVHSQVESAWFSIDLPPWNPQSTLFPIPNLARDEMREYLSYFSFEIDYSLLSAGEHRIYIQTWDSAAGGQPSNPGLVSAVDISVPYRLFIPLVVER